LNISTLKSTKASLKKIASSVPMTGLVQTRVGQNLRGAHVAQGLVFEVEKML
jgi:hypothetical protein